MNSLIRASLALALVFASTSTFARETTYTNNDFDSSRLKIHKSIVPSVENDLCLQAALASVADQLETSRTEQPGKVIQARHRDALRTITVRMADAEDSVWMISVLRSSKRSCTVGPASVLNDSDVQNGGAVSVQN